MKKQVVMTSFVIFAVSVCVLLAPHVISAKMTVGNALGQLDATVPGTGVDKTDLPTYVGVVIKGALGAVGLVFFILMVYGGFLWLTARGEEDQVTKAKDVVKSTIIGLVIVVSAYALTSFITTRLINGPPPGGPSPVAEPVGCCYDWVCGPRTDINITSGIPTWRMDTYSHCKYKGETKGVESDYCAGPEGNGSWQFLAGYSESACKQTFDDEIDI